MQSMQQVATATSAAEEIATDATVTSPHIPHVYFATHYAGTLPVPAETLVQAMDDISPEDQRKMNTTSEKYRHTRK